MASLNVVTLFYRKNRGAGNFSLEASFLETEKHFPKSNRFVLRHFESSYLSNGILNRLRSVFEARRNATDVNHVTGDVHFLTLGLPGKNTILTIHDCGFLERPDSIKRQLLKWVWIDLPVRHCRFVTAVSQATKDEIIRLTGCPEQKVIVVPTTVPQFFHRANKAFDSEYPRFLHIGLAPNKNLDRHVEALAGIPCHLHIIGRLSESHHELLKRHGIRYSHACNISQSEMQQAYADCDALLFASTLEGFGMPIIEAQTVGRPVITANLSSMPEVAGPGGAIFVDPYNVTSIRDGIRRLIQDASLRIATVETGFRNIQRFDAGNIAKQYEALYERIAGETPQN